MLVSFQHRFIFLKTFKTASTSTEIFFEQYCAESKEESRKIDEIVSDKGIIGSRNADIKNSVTFFNHMKALDVKNKIGDEKFENYYKFCNVRNPFDLVVSNYYFFEKYRDLDFNKFRQDEKILTEIKDRIYDIFMIDGDIVVDDFIRYEFLQDDIRRISEKLNLPNSERNLGHWVKSKMRNSSDFISMFDNNSVFKIESIFSEYCQKFGY